MEFTVNNFIKLIMNETMVVSIVGLDSGKTVVEITRKEIYDRNSLGWNYDYEDVANYSVLRWKVEENKVVVFI